VKLRPFAQRDDKQRLRGFRCATKHDLSCQRYVDKMLRTELTPALADHRRDVRAFVAEDDQGRLAGVVALEALGDRDWEVLALGVSIDHHRLGVGIDLVRFGVASSPAAHARSVLFWVHEQNEPMRRLVQRFQPGRTGDPGGLAYDVFSTTPAIILEHDLRIVPAGRGARDDDDRFGLGLGIRLH
jgi:ribosomal protein S18 acetylase RimI-like enzyme